MLYTSARSASSDTVSIRSWSGMISSSQAITTTARNSSPLARCMVAIGIRPIFVSICSSRIAKKQPAASTAAWARSSSFSDRTNMPISWGWTPSSIRVTSHRPTVWISIFWLSSFLISGLGPLNTETVPRRSSVFPSTSANSGPSSLSACALIWCEVR